MAHECPECGQVCYCGSDIDDCVLNHPADQDACAHYLECQRRDLDQDEDCLDGDE